MQTIMVGYHINCHNQNDVYIVISRIEAAASIKNFVAKYYFYVRVASIYGIFCNNPRLSDVWYQQRDQ